MGLATTGRLDNLLSHGGNTGSNPVGIANKIDDPKILT